MNTDKDNQIRNNDTVSKLYSKAPSNTIKDISARTYVSEKTVRITSATLRLTQLMDRDSTMRKDLEETSIGLVRDASILGTSDHVRHRFNDELIVLTALLRTAALSGMLAYTNVTLLCEEVLALASTCDKLELNQGRAFLDQQTLHVDVPHDLFVADRPRTSHETVVGQGRDTTRGAYQGSTADNGQAGAGAQQGAAAGRSVRYQDRMQEVQKDRRATILGLLQKKDRVNVKDVAAVIKDCSEKTIQRELAALVAQGVLKREGERRWSQYLLV